MNKILYITSLVFLCITINCCKTTENKIDVDKGTLANDIAQHVIVKFDTIRNKEGEPKITIDCDKCNIDYVRDIKLNINNLTEDQVALFLCSFDKKCFNNVEFSEFSNKVLFLLLSESPHLAIKTIDKNRSSISISSIQKNLENPISDKIDLKEVSDKIEKIEGYQETKKNVLQSIKIALEKYN